MHKAIFSQKEREIIKECLKTGTEGTGTGFRTLKHRTNKYKETIMADYKLMIQFIEKLATENETQ